MFKVGQTARVIDSNPEIQLEITAVVGVDRVLARVTSYPGTGEQHGYDVSDLRRTFTMHELWKESDLARP